MVGVLQRNSLGVSGVAAIDRFHISAAALSSLAVVQLIVYAALQIPVGILIDRLGPKFLIATGAALMLIGQVVFAFAPSIGVAIVGRILLGAGDAATFISVIRLLSNWFSGRILPQVSQWTGNVGQIGQLLSAVPLAYALHQWGWTAAFLTAASASGIAFVVVLLLISNGRPEPSEPHETQASTMRRLVEALRRPGTQLGFWSHFVSQSSCTVFGLLWGFPFLTSGLGYSRESASVLLGIIVLVGFVSGPILGILSARFPLRRSVLVLGIVIAMAIAWALVLLWPGQPPVWLIVVLIVTISVGGPGSLIGFDFARTYNPKRNLGSATGIVNVGGFLASFTMMYLIGVILDGLAQGRIHAGLPADLLGLDSFRIAFSVQYLVVGAGVIMLLIAQRRTRRTLHEEEGVEVAPLWKVVSRRLRKRNV